ncbi:MAG: 2,3,4,5-tetrahydropyridine-2,6-carboxylate N-succinyltransferase [Pseudomonadota bacterium]|jgi:2,3,4,5-tetrahydropyridine-2-carboxylate N-succinyltransferase
MPSATLQEMIEAIYIKVQGGVAISDLSSLETQQIEQVIEGLDTGTLRVCEKVQGLWITHAWVKQAILLYFRMTKMQTMDAGDFNFFDKIPVKKWSEADKVRVVPPAFVRKGAFVAPGAILMPSYVNIGAYVGSGTMVDTWATVGSCAQIGTNVHLSGGVGIGGVLEPVQANPVIIEDNAFIGSRCIVVEGAVIEEGAVLGAGVTITASTKIIDVTQTKPVAYQGRVPSRSVVIPGTTMKEFAAGTYGVPCALIIGQRKASTDLKTSLTEALRDYQVSV